MECRDFDLTDADAAAFCPSCGAGYTSPGGECADCEEELWPRSRIEEQLKEEIESELDAPTEDALALDETVEPDYNLSDPDAVSFCPSCGAGYTAMAVRCQDCDQELVPRSWVEFRAPAAKAPGDTGDAVHLCEILGRIKAGRLELELAEAGIRFFTRPQHLLGVGGGLHGAIDFFVASKDLERAKGILLTVQELGERTLDAEDEPLE
jgi:hypothetical protein